jgi:uncharacterized spore protein YtfJ
VLDFAGGKWIAFAINCAIPMRVCFSRSRGKAERATSRRSGAGWGGCRTCKQTGRENPSWNVGLGYQISPDQFYLVNTLGMELLWARLNDHIAFWTDQGVAVTSLIARATERERKSRANKTEEENEAKRKNFLEGRTSALRRASANSSQAEAKQEL